MKPEDKGMMVRGVLIASSSKNGMLSVESAKREDEFDTVIAYTHWYMPGDNMAELAYDLNALKRAYSSSEKNTAIMIYYEYREMGGES